ncbi:MACPF domain-containing protein [Dysgonomonas termitidis]|uniref:MACPF domain-containing protein n=1 Tax=Dysgonomonas termitidis TaxID=1516126 RepID=A0ABV9KXA3_9BACT
MKKKINALLLCCLFLFFTGCSNDDDLIVDEPEEKQEEVNPMDAFTPLKSKSATNKKDLLGKGYDYTGSYASDLSVKESIIDMEKYLAEESGRYYKMGCFESSNFTVSGSTAWRYTKHLTNISNDSYWNLIPDNIAAFSGVILDNEMLYNKKDENKEDYSFASIHYYYYWYRHSLNTGPKYLYDYLTTDFTNDLTSLPSNKIIEKYGTHIIIEYVTGMRLDLIYRSKVDKSGYVSPEYDGTYYTEQYVEDGIRHTVRSIGYWPNGPGNPPDENNVKLNGIPILYIENHGGDNSLIPSGVYNLQKQYPQLNINKWFQSLTEDNTALVDLNLDKLIPIYELVTDELKKTELQNAIEKYIKDRQIVFE